MHIRFTDLNKTLLHLESLFTSTRPQHCKLYQIFNLQSLTAIHSSIKRSDTLENQKIQRCYKIKPHPLNRPPAPHQLTSANSLIKPPHNEKTHTPLLFAVAPPLTLLTPLSLPLPWPASFYPSLQCCACIFAHLFGAGCQVFWINTQWYNIY